METLRLQRLSHYTIQIECPQCGNQMILLIGLTGAPKNHALDCLGCHNEILPLVPGPIVGGPFPATDSAVVRVKPSYGRDLLRIAQARQLLVANSYPHSVTGVLIFFAWLEKNRPELLPKDKLGDPFQDLKIDLAGLFKD